MSEIEAARGAFESWLKRENGKWADKITERHPDGRYRAMQAYMDWGAWQAAWAWRESELLALKAQRDELLAAAKSALTVLIQDRDHTPMSMRLESRHGAIRRLSAAIAHAEAKEIKP